MKYLVFAFTVILVCTFHLKAQENTIGWDAERCLVDLSLPENTICGTLTVPENYDDTQSGTIQLSVVIIAARDTTEMSPPLLYTSGGPGGATVYQWLVNFYSQSPLSNNRDVILFGQRGTLGADPYLECPELELIGLELLQTNDTDINDGQLWSSVANECFERLSLSGINLSHYNNEASIQDIDFLRQEINQDALYFLGFSYSTRLALDYTRSYPEHVVGLVLDSAAPPEEFLLTSINANFKRAFDYLFAQCEADSPCREAFPDLERRFYDMIVAYNDQPVALQTRHPYTDELVTLTVTGNDIASVIVSLLYSGDTTELTPLLIETLADETLDPLLPIVDQFIVGVELDASGMYYSTICAEEAPFITPAQIEAARNSISDLPEWYPITFGTAHIICEAWQVSAVEETMREQVSGDIPVLILAGGYDPITPPEWGQQVSQNFPNSYFVEFPSLSHIVFSDHSCARNLVNQFLDNPTVAPDTNCVSNIPNLNFMYPSDIVVTNSLYRVNRDILEGNQQWQLLFPAVILLVSLIQLGLAVWRIIRKSSRMVEYCHLFSSILAIVWLIGLAFVVWNTPELTLAFGLPSWAVWLRFLPFINLAIALVGIGLSLRETITLWAVLFVAHIVFVGWLVAWNIVGI